MRLRSSGQAIAGSLGAAWGWLIEAPGRDKAQKIRSADEPVDLMANPRRSMGSICCEG